MSKWERMARQDFRGEALYRFFERAGKYEYEGGMPREEADRKAFLELAGGKA